MGTLRIEPEISAVSVVLVGEFNPAMLTPAWLAYHDIFNKQEAEEADLQVASRAVTQFSTDWLVLRAASDRFAAETTRSPHIRLRDLVLRIFQEKLVHAPFRAMGLNRSVHFLTPTPEHRDALGRRLAPLDPWMEGSDIVDFSAEPSGMTSLEMRQGNLEGRPPADQINVRIEPSNLVGGGHLGIFVSINDHYTPTGPSGGFGPREDLPGPLASGFERSIAQADKIVDYVMALAKSG